MLLVLATVFGIKAQIITTDPTPLQIDSENIVIYYHADEGSKGLINQSKDDPIYAHTGVLTLASKSSGDWKYAPDWLDNSEKYKMEYVSANLWKLEIGSINEYYGITDPSEVVEKLCFVFRNSTGTKEGKTATGSDIFVDVYQKGFHVAISADKTGNVVADDATTWNFTASSTASAKLTISVNGAQVATKNNATSLIATYTFSARGNYTVTAKAESSSGQIEESSMELCYPNASVAAVYPGGTPQMGAVRNSDGTVTFCLAAPNKKSAMIIASWDDFVPLNENVMKYQDVDDVRYFWTTTTKALDPDEQYLYYYYVDAKYKVGDPYAKLVLDPSNDKYISESVYPDMPQYPSDKVSDVSIAVYHENINKYDWKVRNFKGPAKNDLMIYELLFRDFTGTEGKANANGTVRAAIEKIPYLKRLGINAVELLPINEFNGNNSWGYNPNFYFAPDKAYGTPDDYKEFIDICHANGIAVILDIVFNQTDWQHPWYQLYSRGSNPFYNITAPHAYSVLNDWNQDNPLVQKQFKDVLQYWIKEYNIDGYRFDLVKGLGSNNSYANTSNSATDAYNASRVARMKELQKAIDEVKPDAYFINENLAGEKEENEMAAFGQLNWVNLNYAGCQFAMGYSTDSALASFYAPKASRTWGSTVSYLESHDEERLAYKQDAYGAKGVKSNVANSMKRLGSAAAQMILAPGAHMIWQFSELGNAQTTKKADSGNNTDPKIVNWSLYDQPDHQGLYNCYRELLHLRTDNPELFSEDAEFSNIAGAGNWASGRFLYASGGGKELICVINPLIDNKMTYRVNFNSSDNNNYKIASLSYGSSPSFDAAKGEVEIEPNSYVVIVSDNTAGVECLVFEEDSPINVYGSRGRIVITGEYDVPEIYSVSGIRYHTTEVPAGLYIVHVAGRSFKVAVH